MADGSSISQTSTMKSKKLQARHILSLEPILGLIVLNTAMMAPATRRRAGLRPILFGLADASRPELCVSPAPPRQLCCGAVSRWFTSMDRSGAQRSSIYVFKSWVLRRQLGNCPQAGGLTNSGVGTLLNPREVACIILQRIQSSLLRTKRRLVFMTLFTR